MGAERVREPWFEALVRKLAAPQKRGGIRLTQDDAERLLLLLKAASDVSEYHQRGKLPAGSLPALERFYAEKEPLFDRLRDALVGTPPSRCPRCEGYEATYHTFEGECAFTEPPTDEVGARRSRGANSQEPS